MVGGVEGRVLGVDSAIHAVADQERPTAGAVIRAVAVVPHAPAELGKHEHDDFLGSIVFA